MSTRFYLPAEGSGTPSLSTNPAFDSNWELTTGATRLILRRKTNLPSLSAIANSRTITIPVTTTQDILCNQWISEPIPAQRIIGTVSLVISAIESGATANANLAVSIRVVSGDGATVRGTLFSVFGTDTEFATSASTRIVNAQAVTALTTLPGDRLVVEVGTHVAAPNATTYTMSLGNNNAADFALTSALTTSLNPWVEFSQDIWHVDNNNYMTSFRDGGSGANTGILSFSERIR